MGVTSLYSTGAEPKTRWRWGTCPKSYSNKARTRQTSEHMPLNDTKAIHLVDTLDMALLISSQLGSCPGIRPKWTDHNWRPGWSLSVWFRSGKVLDLNTVTERACIYGTCGHGRCVGEHGSVLSSGPRAQLSHCACRTLPSESQKDLCLWGTYTTMSNPCEADFCDLWQEEHLSPEGSILPY